VLVQPHHPAALQRQAWRHLKVPVQLPAWLLALQLAPPPSPLRAPP
jgi:hypothetical protein